VSRDGRGARRDATPTQHSGHDAFVAAPRRRSRDAGSADPDNIAPAAAQTQTLQVVVPPGTLPGATLQVDSGGALFDVVVPEGVAPGQMIEITVPAAAPPAAEEDKPRRRRVASGEVGKPASAELPSPGKRRVSQPSEADRRKAHSKQFSEEVRKKQLSDREAQRKRETQRASEAQRAARDATGTHHCAPGEPVPEASAAEIIQRQLRRRATPPEPPPPPPPPLSRSSSAARHDAYQPMHAPPASQQAPLVSRGGSAPPPVLGLPPGTAPTEVEHTLLVAFERLGGAHAQL